MKEDKNRKINTHMVPEEKYLNENGDISLTSERASNEPVLVDEVESYVRMFNFTEQNTRPSL
jgi:hypothetical protein